jgi:hypothetical protein
MLMVFWYKKLFCYAAISRFRGLLPVVEIVASKKFPPFLVLHVYFSNSLNGFKSLIL